MTNIKKLFKFQLFLIAIISVFSCSEESHLIENKQKLLSTIDAYNQKYEMFDNEIFSIVDNSGISNEEREALKFIYAYAPLTDLTFSPQGYLDAVRATLDAREIMPWSKEISEDMFLHFVLPLRINNEDIDSARVVIYKALKDRVKNMSLKDAALEVNRWCHEHVIYTSSDSRTSSPLAAMRTAHGRCGEESVFTVAAMRAVGIPARQVYTPRWAHSDDNHAWVEVWGGDKWYYLGACEPEPKLDMGWFTSPSMRGVLMHVKVYGDYNGEEEVIMKTPQFTEINITENYAEVNEIEINVVDNKGVAIEDADIEIKIYNYANFITVAKKKSDINGKASISLGLGDVLVWVTKDNKRGFAECSVKDSDSVTVIVADDFTGSSIEFDITPPVEKKPISIVVSDQEREDNKKSIIVGDSIRNSYIATFMSDADIKALADNLSLNVSDITDYIVASRGNYPEIVKYLEVASKQKYSIMLDMLKMISIKDLRDTKADILLSHTEEALKYKEKYDKEIFNNYLLNPRISNEMVDVYRKEIKAKYGESLDIEQIIKIVAGIRLNNELNSSIAHVRPVTVASIDMADIESRDIFFVAMARTYGIPARLDISTSKIQYYKEGKWLGVNLESLTQEQRKQGTITIAYSPIEGVPDPRYGTHFTISRIEDNGKEVQINMPRNRHVDMGGGASLKEAFSEKRYVDVGKYMLTSGTRLANGSVLTRLLFFDIKENQNSEVELVLRENAGDISVIGSINPELKVSSVDAEQMKSILSITGRGYFMLALVAPRQEPTNHAMRNLVALKPVLEKWGSSVIIAFKDKAEFAKYDETEFGVLPKINYVLDSNKEVEEVMKNLKFDTNTDLPVFIIADTFGRVVFKSGGYQINLGDNIQNVISRL